jgi:uncharacterized caspase-like protein
MTGTHTASPAGSGSGSVDSLAVDTPPTVVHKPQRGRRVALLIANGTFDHPKVEPLRGPVDDARRLEEILGGLGEFTTEVIADATATQVQSRVVDTLENGHPDDVILLYFAGHGTRNRQRDEPYLVTRDTAADQLFNTAVPVSFVLEQVRDSPAGTVVLILNCCFGAAINLPGTTAAEVFGTLGRRGGVRLVISSTNRTGRAYERVGPGPGSGSLFTAALLEGVASPDTRPDGNGWISLQTLFDYAHGVLGAPDRRDPEQPQQEPTMSGEGLGAPIPLIRSPRSLFPPKCRTS